MGRITLDRIPAKVLQSESRQLSGSSDKSKTKQTNPMGAAAADDPTTFTHVVQSTDGFQRFPAHMQDVMQKLEGSFRRGKKQQSAATPETPFDGVISRQKGIVSQERGVSDEHCRLNDRAKARVIERQQKSPKEGTRATSAREMRFGRYAAVASILGKR